MTHPNPETQYRLDHPDRLRVYDATTDNFRDATQDDVDKLSRFASKMVSARHDLRLVAEKYLDMKLIGTAK